MLSISLMWLIAFPLLMEMMNYLDDSESDWARSFGVGFIVAIIYFLLDYRKHKKKDADQ